MTDPFPPPIGAPATRALATAGIATPGQLARWSERELGELHGMGPKAIRILGDHLAALGTGFRPGPAPRQAANGIREVDAYLAAAPSPQRETLAALRETLRTVLPYADEAMKYGMPAFTLDGHGVAGYAAFKEHCSYFPMSSEVIGAAGAALDRYATSKGGIRFGADERFPTSLVRRLVKLRLAEVAAVDDGRRTEYYPDGQRKATGSMKHGTLHGRWQWFRRDGSLLRTGRFQEGERVGTWVTWDEAGNVVRTTDY
jgi:uncharacterized protein YdhG (YjbR/CyaY superfamily)